MNYTEQLTLIPQVLAKDSETGVFSYTDGTSKVVYAIKNVVGSKEYYNATSVGITPVAELQIKASNYNNETIVSYNGNRYSVIRTIPKGRFDLVLVIGLKQGTNG